MADAPDLGSGSVRSEGSSPFIRINIIESKKISEQIHCLLDRLILDWLIFGFGQFIIAIIQVLQNLHPSCSVYFGLSFNYALEI